MEVEDCSRLVAEEAAGRARAALLRRCLDLAHRGGQPRKVPPEEQAQVALDTLAFVREMADRLRFDMTALVFEARCHGASWARVGLAVNESPQTAFNRYRHLERPGQVKEVEKHSPRERAGG